MSTKATTTLEDISEESGNAVASKVKIIPTEPGTNGQLVYRHVNTVSITIDEEKIEQLSSNKGICFHDICYEVIQRKFCKRLPNKKILKNVSGLMGPGLNAIMGPTGSGKTSLLDILAARKGKRGITGKVLVNGQRQPDNFKCISGYVVQDDVVMGTLTVRENLYFSAALRLSTKMSWTEKRQRVQKVIEELGLTDCADTKVGTAFIRGVSGGERKRTNIGMELIIEPQVLFLDEPTTGLDAFTAVSVVQLLKNLSKVGDRVVIMSIHQPRYSIYKLFDTLTLLSRGDLVYHGPNHSALDYFNRLGYICEEHDNPADVMLDVINQCEKSTKTDSEMTDNGKDLSSLYVQSYLGKTSRKKSQDLFERLKNKEKQGGGSRIRSSHKYATNFFWQLLVMIIRSTLNIVRNPQLSMLQVMVVIVFAVMVGLLYFQLDTGSNGYQNRIGAIFFMVLNQIFSNMNAVELFISQKPLFIHENASGFYRVSVYYLAKLTCDIIPLRVIPLCFYTLIAYFMIGFQIQADKFFIFFMTLFLISLAASSAAFCVSALVNVTAIATLMLAMFFVIQMLFGGFFIALESLPVWLQWLQYVSIFRYGVEALAVNEITGLTFNVTINNMNQEVTGESLLAVQGFDPDWLFYDWIGLSVFVIVLITLAYIVLRLLKKEK